MSDRLCKPKRCRQVFIKNKTDGLSRDPLFAENLEYGRTDGPKLQSSRNFNGNAFGVGAAVYVPFLERILKYLFLAILN